MNGAHGDTHGVQSESSIPEKGTQITSVPSRTTVQQPEPFDKKDLKTTTTCLKESELSQTDEHSGKENSCLISPLSKSTPVSFDVRIKDADVKKLSPTGHITEACPVCVQLPANHLKKTHSTYKVTHRHRKISQSSNSTLRTRLSLQAPVEDLCASFLLACLFCKFGDCALAVGDGCQYCVSSICSSVCSCVCCCCEPSSLEDAIDLSPCGSCVEYVEACGCSCGGSSVDCSACDLCLQTSECLELGMELSQLMFH